MVDDKAVFDFRAETHAKNLPTEGWHQAAVNNTSVSENPDATWVSLPLKLDSGHRIDDVLCINAEADGKFASRVSEGRRRLHKYLTAGNCATQFESPFQLEAALAGAAVEVQIRWRDPFFPVPTVRDVRGPEQHPQDAGSGMSAGDRDE